eukprot:scaffold37129_cov21-Prasinocladus_malaysianus.AAC.1
MQWRQHSNQGVEYIRVFDNMLLPWKYQMVHTVGLKGMHRCWPVALRLTGTLPPSWFSAGPLQAVVVEFGIGTCNVAKQSGFCCVQISVLG